MLIASGAGGTTVTIDGALSLDEEVIYAEGLERAQKRGTDPVTVDVIRDTYRDRAGIDAPTLEPSSNARADARRVLGRVDLSF